MKLTSLEGYIDRLVTLWVGQVMFPGKLVYADSNEAVVESHQYKGLAYTINIESITAVSCDENIDTTEKFEAAKKAAEDKQKADAEEYRRLAAEIEKETLQ